MTNNSNKIPRIEDHVKPLKKMLVFVTSVLILFVSILVAISLGAANIDLPTVWNAIFHYDATRQSDSIIVGIRLPREISAALVGAALAVSGAIMQGITRNSLADPGLLGLNAGASLALAMIFAFWPEANYLTTMVAAFMGAGVGAMFVFSLGSLRKGGMTPLRIILSGAVVSAFLIALAEGIALYFKLSQDLAFWSAGGVAGTNWSQLKIVAPFVVIGILIAVAYSRHLSVLSLNEEVAKGLGQQTTYIKIILMLVVLVLAGAAVSIVGTIAFVGLFVPHIVRFLVGSDYRWIIPCTAVIGSVFMVIADTSARLISAPYETPIGAIVSIIGVPFFLYLARRGGVNTK